MSPSADAESENQPTNFLTPSQVNTLCQTLTSAVSSSDWLTALRLLELHWEVLAALRPHALDAALHEIPCSIASGRSLLGVIREIRLRVKGDSTSLDRASALLALPSDPVSLDAAARGSDGATLLATAEALMVAYRVHGQHRKAARFANLTDNIAQIVRTSQPLETVSRIPTALLQTGITRMVSGDVHQASITLRESYALRHESWDVRHPADAAGKLALLYAVRGETETALTWLRRHDEALGSVSSEPVALSGDIARTLTAVAALDRNAADAALNKLELRVDEERSWAPYIVYARAQHALFWGDYRAALRQIERTRTFVGASLHHMTVGPLLDAAQANLLLALNRPTEAHVFLSTRSTSADVGSVNARLALLAGRTAVAHEIATAWLGHANIDTRSQLDLLITSALAAELPQTGVGHLEQAIATAWRTRTVSPFALAPRIDVQSLLSMVEPDRARDWITSALASSPEPLPSTAQLIELTTTEQRFLQLTAQGLTRQAIAQVLFVSTNTVKFHMRNLYRKLGVNCRERAVTRARELGILDSRPTEALRASSSSSHEKRP